MAKVSQYIFEFIINTALPVPNSVHRQYLIETILQCNRIFHLILSWRGSVTQWSSSRPSVRVVQV